MNRFKVGDRVVVTRAGSREGLIGKHGTVLDDDWSPWVQFDEPIEDGIRPRSIGVESDNCACVYEMCLELEPPAVCDEAPVQADAPAQNAERISPEAFKAVAPLLVEAPQPPESTSYPFDAPLTRTSAVIDAATAYRVAYERVNLARAAIIEAQEEERQAIDAMQSASFTLLERARGEAA